jgi:hypothetical protein
MKKNANKQREKAVTALKGLLREDGRKLTWLSHVTDIHYQRLQRIINQGYDPTITEAAKISTALGKPVSILFPSSDPQQVVLRPITTRSRSRR